MRALVKDLKGLGIDGDWPEPQIAGEDDVIVEIRAAGVCRSDLFVAEGRIPARAPVVLGHEGAGVVVARGSSVAIPIGAHVSIRPMLTCGDCRLCASTVIDGCLARRMLGVDVDGVFAERVVVPATNVIALPSSVPWTHAAYLEPLAAALAVLRPLRTVDRDATAIAVVGKNRIAELTSRVLRNAGFERVEIVAEDAREDPPGHAVADVVIETTLSSAAVTTIVNLARPGGMVILKSRPPTDVPFPVATLVRKELRLHAAHYAPWAEARSWLIEGRVDLDDLIGEVFPLSAYRAAFLAAASERDKPFLNPSLRG